MSRRERDRLRAQIDTIGSGKGGLGDADVAKNLAHSILLLDESNELSSRVNVFLTVVLLLVGIVQVCIMVTGSPQPTERFRNFGDDIDTAIDTKTGLTCWAQPGDEIRSGGLIGQTLTMTNGFLPLCADIYRHEDRVLNDFETYMRREPRQTTKQP